MIFLDVNLYWFLKVNFIIYINYFESIVIRKYLDIEQVFDLIGEYVDGCFGGKFVD